MEREGSAMLRTACIYLTIIILAISIYSAIQRKYSVLSHACVGCGDCIHVCVKGAITIKRGKAVIDPSLCIGCSHCAYICSYNAIRRSKD